MHKDQLAELAIFIERFVKKNYFREIEKWQISAFQDRLRSYDLSEVKIAFEKHLSNPKKAEYMPTPQNIIAELGFRQKQRDGVGYACGFNVGGIPCGRKYDFGFQRKDESYFYLCEQHYDEVREKGDVEVEMLRRAKQYSDAAKHMGLSNYEFLYEKKPPERALKELLGWASHGRRM